jgi:fermentation-respiration switch protein FrsA (DUF1100 family)
MAQCPEEADRQLHVPATAEKSSGHGKRARARLMRLARLVVIVYLGVLIVLYALQTRLIFPGASTQGQPFAEVRPRPGTELVRLTTQRGVPVVALFGSALATDGGPDPAAAARPTMLYFYGNAMCLNYAMPEFDRFRRLGLNVLFAEFAGYGASGGTPSEEGCQDTALAAYDYLVSTRNVDRQRVISAGWSLGGAVAIDLASRRQVGGLIAFSSFTSAVDLARRVVPWVPVSLLLRHRFESAQKIAGIRCRILIGHGRADSIVPFSMGEALAATAGGPVTTLWIDDAEHNDFYEIGGRQIDDAIVSFVRGLR